MAAKNRLFRHPLSRIEVVTDLGDPEGDGKDMTHQSHAASCDINTIIRQFDRTGVLPQQRSGIEPIYDDVSELNRPYSELLDEARDTLQRSSDEINSHREKKAKAKSREKADEEQHPLPLNEPSSTPPSPTPPDPKS